MRQYSQRSDARSRTILATDADDSVMASGQVTGARALGSRSKSRSTRPMLPGLCALGESASLPYCDPSTLGDADLSARESATGRGFPRNRWEVKFQRP